MSSRRRFVTPAQSLYSTVVAHTGGYTYVTKVWALSIVQGPFCVALVVRFATESLVGWVEARGAYSELTELFTRLVRVQLDRKQRAVGALYRHGGASTHVHGEAVGERVRRVRTHEQRGVTTVRKLRPPDPGRDVSEASVSDRSRGRFATPTHFPLQDRSKPPRATRTLRKCGALCLVARAIFCAAPCQTLIPFLNSRKP
jgi:hypothetical protein